MAKTETGDESTLLHTLSQLETLCHAPLPATCRAIYAAYPEILRHALRANDGSNSEGFVSEAELLADPGDVLNINHEVRLHSITDPEGREFSWPDTFLVIGETGDGDYYCVDASGEHEGVMQFRHHAVEFEVVAESMEEFAELLIECFVTDLEAEDSDEFDSDEFDDDEFVETEESDTDKSSEPEY